MDVLLSIAVFVGFGAAFVLVNLLAGKLLRTQKPNADKGEIYECGEPTIGSSWVQFDLRFYIVALVFLIFDVEIALFFPWAIAYGQARVIASQSLMTVSEVRGAALLDMLIFFGLLVVGFAYLWRFGFLDWVRSSATTSIKLADPASAALARQSPLDRPIAPSTR